MGKQSGVVMVAVVALHVALVLMIVSTATTEWIEGELQQNYTRQNDTNQTTEVNKGLWVACEEGDCNKINSTLKSDWFTACQSLSVIGCAGTIVAVVCYYIILLVATMSSSFQFHTLITSVQFLATAAFVACVIVFGVKAKDDTLDFGDHFDFKLGWSFDVAIAGAVVSFLAFLASCHRACLLRNERPGYENI